MRWFMIALAVINLAYLGVHLASHASTAEGRQGHPPLHAGQIRLLPPGSVRPQTAAVMPENSPSQP